MNGDCIEWKGGKSPKGYGNSSFNGRPCRAHRLAYCVANGLSLDDIKGKLVRHTCDNPGCVNPKHLLLGSDLENYRDAVDRNRRTDRQTFPVGKDHPKARLVEKDVHSIRAMLGDGSDVSEVARIFSVGRTTIRAIRDGITWRHV